MSGLRHIAKRAAAAALFSFLLPSSGVASAQAAVKPVARPEAKADDQLQVSFIDARPIHTVLVRQGKRRESDATWTPEWIEASGVWRRLDKQTSGWCTSR